MESEDLIKMKGELKKSNFFEYLKKVKGIAGMFFLKKQHKI